MDVAAQCHQQNETAIDSASQTDLQQLVCPLQICSSLSFKMNGCLALPLALEWQSHRGWQEKMLAVVEVEWALAL